MVQGFETGCANADTLSTDGSSQGALPELDGDKQEQILPSETTDTEPWSTNADMLHEATVSGHAASCNTTKDAIGFPASLNSLLEPHAGIEAEPTISITSIDVSPDRSS